MQKVTVTYVPQQESPEQVKKISLSETCRKIVFNSAQDTLSVGNQELNDYFKRWRGVRYRYGGYSTRGVDCSGLTQRAYKELYGVELPRTVVEQSKTGEKIDKKSLRPGDLVFFKTGLYSRHVGIYLGENCFIHASRSKGVIQSNLNNSYWRKKYWQAKRYHLAKS
ncbi:NlpC/P60 family protein [Desulforhopalus sp. 52FAK]